VHVGRVGETTKFVEFWPGILNRGGNLEDVGVVSVIILKLILRE
jgi:hypothetical protein